MKLLKSTIYTILLLLITRSFFGSVSFVGIYPKVDSFSVPLSLLSNAISNISMHIYSLDSPTVAETLWYLAEKGVKIRIITDSDNWNNICSWLDSHTNIVVINDRKTNIYITGNRESHNKFFVIDYNISSSPVANTVWIASQNFSTHSETFAYNVGLVISNDIYIAKGFMEEFNEMWGYPDTDAFILEYNAEDSRFGSAKSFFPPGIVTNLDGTVMALFGPTDPTAKEFSIKNIIITNLQSAKSNIYILAFSFTDKDIAEVLKEKAQSGVYIYAIFDYKQSLSPYSVYNDLSNYKEGKIYAYRFLQNFYMHAKMILIDPFSKSPKLMLGSYNFTMNADKVNDESWVICSDTNVVKSALEYFLYLLKIAGGNFYEVQEIPIPNAIYPTITYLSQEVYITGFRLSGIEVVNVGDVSLDTNQFSVEGQTLLKFQIPLGIGSGVYDVSIVKGGFKIPCGKIIVVSTNKFLGIIESQGSIVPANKDLSLVVISPSNNISAVKMLKVKGNISNELDIGVKELGDGVFEGVVKVGPEEKALVIFDDITNEYIGTSLSLEMYLKLGTTVAPGELVKIFPKVYYSDGSVPKYVKLFAYPINFDINALKVMDVPPSIYISIPKEAREGEKYILNIYCSDGKVLSPVQEIYFYVTYRKTVKNSIFVYPNAVKTGENIKMETDIFPKEIYAVDLRSYKVYKLRYRVVMEKLFELDTSILGKGIYKVIVIGEDGKDVFTKIVVY